MPVVTKSQRLAQSGFSLMETAKKTLETDLAGLRLTALQYNVSVVGQEMVPVKYPVAIVNSQAFVEKYENAIFSELSKYPNLKMLDNDKHYLILMIEQIVNAEISKGHQPDGVALDKENM